MRINDSMDPKTKIMLESLLDAKMKARTMAVRIGMANELLAAVAKMRTTHKLTKTAADVAEELYDEAQAIGDGVYVPEELLSELEGVMGRVRDSKKESPAQDSPGNIEIVGADGRPR